MSLYFVKLVGFYYFCIYSASLVLSLWLFFLVPRQSKQASLLSVCTNVSLLFFPYFSLAFFASASSWAMWACSTGVRVRTWYLRYSSRAFARACWAVTEPASCPLWLRDEWLFGFPVCASRESLAGCACYFVNCYFGNSCCFSFPVPRIAAWGWWGNRFQSRIRQSFLLLYSLSFRAYSLSFRCYYMSFLLLLLEFSPIFQYDTHAVWSSCCSLSPRAGCSR